jgi:hypothetical protein
MRYAIYTSTGEDYSFSSSYPTEKLALEEMARIRNTYTKVKPIMIVVRFPDQKVDPYAHNFAESFVKEDAHSA